MHSTVCLVLSNGEAKSLLTEKSVSERSYRLSGLVGKGISHSDKRVWGSRSTVIVRGTADQQVK